MSNTSFRKRTVRRGRPSMFEGERHRVTVSLTDKAIQLLDTTQSSLEGRGYPEACRSSAAEYLIRKAGKVGLRLTRPRTLARV